MPDKMILLTYISGHKESISAPEQIADEFLRTFKQWENSPQAHHSYFAPNPDKISSHDGLILISFEGIALIQIYEEAEFEPGIY